jgi:hypothetical protein
MTTLRLRLALDDDTLGRLVAKQTVTVSGDLPRTGYARGLDRIEIELCGLPEESVEVPHLTVQSQEGRTPS